MAAKDHLSEDACDLVRTSKQFLKIESSSLSMKTYQPINEIRSTMHFSIMHFNHKNLARYEDIQKQMWSQTNLNCETFEWPTNLIQMFLFKSY